MCNILDGDGLPAWPERAARRTAANAALADFRREYATWIIGPATPAVQAKASQDALREWAVSWSLRLAAELSNLISCVQATPGTGATS